MKTPEPIRTPLHRWRRTRSDSDPGAYSAHTCRRRFLAPWIAILNRGHAPSPSNRRARRRLPSQLPICAARWRVNGPTTVSSSGGSSLKSSTVCVARLERRNQLEQAERVDHALDQEVEVIRNGLRDPGRRRPGARRASRAIAERTSTTFTVHGGAASLENAPRARAGRSCRSSSVATLASRGSVEGPCTAGSLEASTVTDSRRVDPATGDKRYHTGGAAPRARPRHGGHRVAATSRPAAPPRSRAARPGGRGS